MKILNFGSLNIDYVYKVKHFVRPGETLSSEQLDIFPGGKGLNQSIALARAGFSELYHAGMIGKEDGKFLKGLLDNNGVKVELIKEADYSSGHAIIQVDNQGENCILLYGGANRQLNEEFTDEVLGSFHEGDYIILQNEVNLLDYIITAAKKRGLIIFLNPSPMSDNIFKLPLQYVDYFILNEMEAYELCDRKDNGNIIDLLSQAYPKANIVITKGKKGVIYKGSDGEVLEQGAFDVKAVDTTAAGDTFTGYFIASVAKGYKPEKALDLASRAAAIAVSKNGAEPSIPKLEEVINNWLR
jgi:ribokinase